MNPILADFNNTDAETITTSSVIVSVYDDSGNLLIKKSGSAAFDIAANIPLRSVGFDNVKVEAKYDVNITELS